MQASIDLNQSIDACLFVHVLRIKPSKRTALHLGQCQQVAQLFVPFDLVHTKFLRFVHLLSGAAITCQVQVK